MHSVSTVQNNYDRATQEGASVQILLEVKLETHFKSDLQREQIDLSVYRIDQLGEVCRPAVLLFNRLRLNSKLIQICCMLQTVFFYIWLLGPCLTCWFCLVLWYLNVMKLITGTFSGLSAHSHDMVRKITRGVFPKSMVANECPRPSKIGKLDHIPLW